ncbi:uncharacterized protein MELLADRAFT_93462 [Melampsora larici-populina 98AG31]|uniref:GCM domain-containing protein n=1 Tax=Melampsora larici-populina (strain 98AG31 / pathotype 3-4-7) TaxID=747676 RepID=F4RAG9_MELLP|nr:uncharacterized protein MELLADRAFT_93462 [Melampsora larici-populina 98AG31]EGG10783.1 hypothetical protein MELLADRAFT_93462 [Melampsora larici-populina 98AG31]
MASFLSVLTHQSLSEGSIGLTALAERTMSLVILRTAPGLHEGSPQPITPFDMARFMLSSLAVPPQSYDPDSRPISVFNCHQVLQLFRSYQFSKLSHFDQLYPLDQFLSFYYLYHYLTFSSSESFSETQVIMSDIPSPRSVTPEPDEVIPLPTQSDAQTTTSVTHVSETPPPSPTKLKRRPPKKTGKKFKLLVPASGELVTYIDHGTTRDPQGYPLYPNGDTVFVREPHVNITNFGHVAYTHTQKTKGIKDGPWKTIWYACLGVLRCDDDFCAYAAPPPTAEGKAAEYIKENPVCPAVECSGTHIWTQCPGTICRIDIQKDTGWGVLCHSGFHAHPWPASKKANPLAMLDLTQEVVKNPKAGPLVLKVGQAGAGQTITPPVVDIHPAFANGGRLAYLRRKVLVEKGLIPEKESKGGGDRLIMDLMHWGNEILHRWIPIQLTWMWGLEESHYRAHFLTLLQQIQAADLTYHERDLLVQQVVDFSTAQKKGFVSAYMDIFQEHDPAKALSKLKGCHEHYRQSITRIKKNHNVVDASRVGEFERLALDLLEPNQPGNLTLIEKFGQIARLFPKAKPWIDWWNTADIHSILSGHYERTRVHASTVLHINPLNVTDPVTVPSSRDSSNCYFSPNPSKGTSTTFFEASLSSMVTAGNRWSKQWDGQKNGLVAGQSLTRPGRNLESSIDVGKHPPWRHCIPPSRLCGLWGPRARSVLTRGLKSVQSAVQNISPDSFVTDLFCSADLFMEYLLMAKRNRPTSAGRQFAYKFNLRCCTTCRTDHTQHSTSAEANDGTDELTMGETDDIPRLYERCRLDFTEQPMNVYFHLRGVAGLTEDDRISFMGEMNWPESLVLNGVSYEIVSRGFWGYHHYWSKVVRHVDGVRGVWFFDDRKDDGRAQLLGRELSLIAGPQPSTSWLIYSRKPMPSEQKIIDLGIAKISSKNPDAQGDLPFLSRQELEDVEDIEEDLPALFEPPLIEPPLRTVTSGKVQSQPPVNAAKLAFTSAASPAVDELEPFKLSQPVGSHAGLQIDKAKEAFKRAEKCPLSSAPPTVMRREEEEGEDSTVPASQPELTKGCVKGPLSVRLRLNKRQKSQSPSPPKAKAKKKAAKGKRGLDVVKEEDVVEEGEKVQVVPKATKGRKKK